MPTPFIIIDWHDDFMSALSERVLERTSGDTGLAVLVFPHSRPKRYANAAFAQRAAELKHPLILPRMLTLGELSGLFGAELGLSHRKKANKLDRISILHGIVTDLGLTQGPLDGFCRMDGTEFYPWGERLAAVFEDCAANRIVPSDLEYTEDIVTPFAASLLQSLGRIYARYRAALGDAGMTTAAIDASDIAESLRRRPILPESLKGRHLFLCGFGMPNGTEDILLKSLWEAGAEVLLHGDAALADGTGYAPECEGLRKWISRWHATAHLHRKPTPITQDILLFAGHDLHSQLRAMGEDLLACDTATPKRTAVVLTHADPLVPTLRTLSDPTVNVSMGYPMRSTLLLHLLHGLSEMEENRRADGAVYWKNLLTLIRHPYVRLIFPNGDPPPTALKDMEKALRTGHSYVDQDAIIAAAASGTAETDNAGGLGLIAEVLGTFRSLGTLAMAARRLSALCDRLTETATADRLAQLDKEAIYRLRTSVIPTLSESIMAESPLEGHLIRSIVLNLAEGERIPFETETSDGIQVLGMLETRLIHFDNVLLLEATEDHLPGASMQDPLLPEALRRQLGLPGAGDRETATAYTFARLIAGAKVVRIYWQEGVVAGKCFDSRKCRSRLVESLIWRREQDERRILAAGVPPLRSAVTRFPPPAAGQSAILRGAAQNGAMERILAGRLSATLLDAYLRCPLRFAYERLCRLTPLQEADEGDEPAKVGLLMHEVLRQAFTPHLGKTVGPKTPDADGVTSIFHRLLAEQGLDRTLPQEQYVMLRELGPMNLRRYLESITEPMTVLHLEAESDATIDLYGDVFTLNGKFDRVDRRRDGVTIIDYKTGKPKKANGFLNDETLWSRIDAVLDRASSRSTDPFEDDPELLADVRHVLPSVQLPLYLHLARHEFGQVHDAVLISLSEAGKEIPFFPKKADDGFREEILSRRIPALLRFLILHMRRSGSFSPIAGRHCRYCPFIPFCQEGVRENHA